MEPADATTEGCTAGAGGRSGQGTARRRRGCLSRRCRAGMAREMARQSESIGKGTLHLSALAQMAKEMAAGKIKVIDLTETLSPEFPYISLPPEMGQAWPFRIEEVSRYDERGPAWYWNNFSCGEHTGTHFDAPAHWVTGKDYPNNATDSIPVEKFFAPACVIDVSREVAANADFLLTPAHIVEWEKTHGRIEAGSWVLMRTD